MPSFRSRNCFTVIAPELSAPRPYCTPTLSHGRSANPGIPYRGVVTGDVDAAGDGIGALRLVGRVDPRLDALVSADRYFLRVGEAGRIGHREVMRQQVHIERAVGDRKRIGE